MSGPFHYCLFGLRLRSEIELPELPMVESGEESDVEIAFGTVPATSRSEDGYLIDGDGAGFVVDGVAAYWITAGSRVTVQRKSGTPMRNIRLYLLGSAMGVLLHQRGMMPLHANAIDVGGWAIAFLGHSGAGKSTLAAASHDAGYQVLADDVCVVEICEGNAFVHPGIPRLRLSEEMLEASGRDARNFQLSYEGDDSFRKFDVPIQGGNDAIPLRVIYKLTEGPEFALQEMRGVAAVDAVFANTYRGGFIRSGGMPSAHWETGVRLIRSTPIFEFFRPRDLQRLAQDLGSIVRHAREIAVR